MSAFGQIFNMDRLAEAVAETLNRQYNPVVLSIHHDDDAPKLLSTWAFQEPVAYLTHDAGVQHWNRVWRVEQPHCAQSTIDQLAIEFQGERPRAFPLFALSHFSGHLLHQFLQCVETQVKHEPKVGLFLACSANSTPLGQLSRHHEPLSCTVLIKFGTKRGCLLPLHRDAQRRFDHAFD